MVVVGACCFMYDGLRGSLRPEVGKENTGKSGRSRGMPGISKELQGGK